jgi:Rrf2 family protein
MKLTRASSYALQAVVYMAGQKPLEKPVASHVIAESRKIPERFLLKVLKPLVSAEILHSIKGPNGGYRLAKPANEITMLKVIEAVDGPIRGQAPPNSRDPHNHVWKRMEHVCSQIGEQMRKGLDKVKISELLRDKD